jgi:hypothetical protein
MPKQFTVAFTGQQLIDAVKAVANRAVVVTIVFDGQKCTSLGQASRYPYENLMLRADDIPWLVAHGQYQSFTVEKGYWSRDIVVVDYDVRYDQQVVDRTIDEFGTKILARLQG